MMVPWRATEKAKIKRGVKTGPENRTKKKLRKIEWMRDITPPNTSHQYAGPPGGCVITHHTKIAIRRNPCNNNKVKLVKPPRGGFQVPVNRSTNCERKMICHRCPQLRQELQKTRDNVHLIESLLEEAKGRVKTQETLDRLSMLHKHCRKNYNDMANITFVINNCPNRPRCQGQ